MSEGEGAASYTAEIAAIATRERDRIDGRLEALLVELESVRAEKRKIDSVVKALNGSVGKPGRKAGGAGKPYQVSAAKREAFMAFVTGNEDEITSTSLREALHVSVSYAASLLKQMRSEGIVRLSATQGSLNIYRSLV